MLAVASAPSRSEEYELWVAVLDRARLDSLGDINPCGAGTNGPALIDGARAWWSNAHGPAEWICTALGLDRAILVAALKLQWVARDGGESSAALEILQQGL